MKQREHFLLGTEQATISVTAKSDLGREELFQHALTAILTRYQQEFDREACKIFLETLLKQELENIEWRIKPEESCWSMADKLQK